MLLVLLNEHFEVVEMYEAERAEVCKARSAPGSKARSERGSRSGMWLGPRKASVGPKLTNRWQGLWWIATGLTQGFTARPLECYYFFASSPLKRLSTSSRLSGFLALVNTIE